jgi:hypothetical protein
MYAAKVVIASVDWNADSLTQAYHRFPGRKQESAIGA